MCLINIKSKDGGFSTADTALFENAVYNGVRGYRDGHGFAVYHEKTGSIYMKKFLEVKPSEFLESIYDNIDSPEDTIITHHRAGTGGTRSLENCQPILISRVKELVDITEGLYTSVPVLAHNGIFNTTSISPYDKEKSDTWNFCQNFISDKKILAEFIEDPDKFRLKHIRMFDWSKLAVLIPKLGLFKCGEYKEENGYFFSNGSYKSSKIIDIGGTLYNKKKEEDDDNTIDDDDDDDITETLITYDILGNVRNVIYSILKSPFKNILPIITEDPNNKNIIDIIPEEVEKEEEVYPTFDFKLPKDYYDLCKEDDKETKILKKLYKNNKNKTVSLHDKLDPRKDLFEIFLIDEENKMEFEVKLNSAWYKTYFKNEIFNITYTYDGGGVTLRPSKTSYGDAILVSYEELISNFTITASKFDEEKWNEIQGLLFKDIARNQLKKMQIFVDDTRNANDEYTLIDYGQIDYLVVEEYLKQLNHLQNYEYLYNTVQKIEDKALAKVEHQHRNFMGYPGDYEQNFN